MVMFIAGFATAFAIALIILLVYCWPLVPFLFLVFLNWIRGRRWYE